MKTNIRNIIEIFYFIDGFCKGYEKIKKCHELVCDNTIKKCKMQFTCLIQKSSLYLSHSI